MVKRYAGELTAWYVFMDTFLMDLVLRMVQNLAAKIDKMEDFYAAISHDGVCWSWRGKYKNAGCLNFNPDYALGLSITSQICCKDGHISTF